MRTINDKINNEKFNKLVEIISLCNTHVIGGIPANQLLNLKKRLESKKELSDYTFTYNKPLEKCNILTATNNYGESSNA